MSSSTIDLAGVLDVEQTLDRVEELFRGRLAAEAESFVLAAHFADLYPAESLRRPGRAGRGAGVRGGERAVQLGGAGTPSVAEFACLELGGRMQMGSWAARRYLADALDVRHRFPLCWQQVVTGRARIPWGRLVASRTRHLSVEAAGVVDAAMAGFVDGSLPFGRFETRLVGVIVAADPEAAAEREAAREQEQFAKRTRSSEDGTAGFYVRSSIGVIARLDASVAYIAAALLAFGDIDPLEVRRVKAMLILATPTQAVQVLAAYAAHRARSTPSSNDDNSPDNGSASGDVEPPVEDPSSGGCGDGDEPEPPPETGPETGPVSAPESALDRMDAFARRVGFTPRRMPTWLTVPDTPPDTEPSRDRGGETADGAGGDRGGGPGGRAGGSGPPGFVFDWTTLLPQVTLNLHVADETIRRDADPCHDGDGGPAGAAVMWPVLVGL